MRPLDFWSSVLASFVALAMLCPTAHGQAGSQSLLEGKIFNPTFSPSNHSILAFERQVGSSRELYLWRIPGQDQIQQISAVKETAQDQETTPGIFGMESEQDLDRFEGQLRWRPVLDPQGRQWFVFSSSASESGSGLYLSYVTAEGELADTTIALPFEGTATFPSWSPDGNQIVFSGSPSDQTGSQLFLYSNLGPVFRKKGIAGRVLDGQIFGQTSDEGVRSPVQLTDNPAGNLHPAWSPAGKYIAFQAQRPSEGGSMNWGINLLDLSQWSASKERKPRSVRLTGQLAGRNEYKPSWAPAGDQLAFYVTQSKVGSGEGRKQDIGILALVSGPQGLVQRGVVRTGYSGDRLARGVLVNESRGPEWHPTIPAVIYVDKDPEAGNPIRIANVSKWSSDEAKFDRSLSSRFEESTRLHKEVAATLIRPNGLRLAFASLVENNDRLQVRDLSGLGGVDAVSADRDPFQIPTTVGRKEVFRRSALFPGLGHFRRDEPKRGWIYAVAGGVTLTTALVAGAFHEYKVSTYNSHYDEFAKGYYNGNIEDPSARFNGGKLFSDLQAKYSGIEGTATLRNVALAAFVGVWGWALYDSVNGLPKQIQIPVTAGNAVQVESPKIGISPVNGDPSLHLSLRIRF